MPCRSQPDGLRTAAIVGVDATAATASELDMLRDAGVDLLLVPLEEGPIYHNLETPAGRVQTSVATGVPLHVLSHEEEAYLTLLGVTEGRPVERAGLPAVAERGQLADDPLDVVRGDDRAGAGLLQQPGGSSVGRDEREDRPLGGEVLEDLPG